MHPNLGALKANTAIRVTKEQAAAGDPSDADDALSDQQLLARWRARVAHARRLRRDWETKFQVETLERMYLGEQTDIGSARA